MSVEQMRNEIKKPYGPKWHKRVDKMPDKQVIAIYYRFRRDKII